MVAKSGIGFSIYSSSEESSSFVSEDDCCEELTWSFFLFHQPLRDSSSVSELSESELTEEW